MRSVLLVVLALSGATGQTIPENAHVNLYFPHIQDGGAATSQWQTRFTFFNPSKTTVSGGLYLYAPDGSRLNVDFGTGPGSRWSFTLPALGVRVFTTTAKSPATLIGWAQVVASMPIQGTVTTRLIKGGVLAYEFASENTLPSVDFSFAASTPYIGFSVANVYQDTALSVLVIARDTNGNVAGQREVVVPALGSRTFSLTQLFPSLNRTQPFSLEVLNTTPTDVFVAEAVLESPDAPIYSLARGKIARPISQWDRIWLVFRTVLNAASETIGPDPVELRISYAPVINALAGSGSYIQINMALAELINDSPSELAAVIGHELGHTYQQRSGSFSWDLNPELDADIWGLVFSLLAGYDPYAAAGTLAKLAMVTGKSGLATQFEDQLSGDAHQSFNTRIENMFDTIASVCKVSDSLQAACDAYKGRFHPSFPVSAPLSVPRRGWPAWEREGMKLESQ